MIDQERRKKLALHLRHLSVGLTSNDQFESAVMKDVTRGWLPEQYYRDKKAKSDDPIIIPMLELCWDLYDDTKRHWLTGKHKLSEENLKIIARFILFLHSDKEYEWPHFDSKRFSLMDYILAILTFGQHYRNKRSEIEQSFKEFQKLGDHEYWPFFKKKDYTEQLTKQPFLSSQQASA